VRYEAGHHIVGRSDYQEKKETRTVAATLPVERQRPSPIEDNRRVIQGGVSIPLYQGRSCWKKLIEGAGVLAS
jgi:hypothetical protein